MRAATSENMEIIERIRDFLKFMVVVIVSVFAPIQNSIIVLMLFFLVNFFIGFRTDVRVNNAEFSLKKAFEGIKMLILYYTLVFIIHMGIISFNEISLAEKAAKFITWIVCYWYLVNMLRNIKKIWPKNETISFLYDLLTVEIFTMLMNKFGINKDKYENKDEE